MSFDEFKAEIVLELRRASNYVDDYLGDAIEWYEANPLHRANYLLALAEEDMTGDAIRDACKYMRKLFYNYKPYTLLALVASADILDKNV